MSGSVCLIIFAAGLFFANSIGNVRRMNLAGELGALPNLGGYTAGASRSPDTYRDPAADARLWVVVTDRDNNTSEVYLGYRRSKPPPCGYNRRNLFFRKIGIQYG